VPINLNRGFHAVEYADVLCRALPMAEACEARGRLTGKDIEPRTHSG
jgi:hypothetical protein